MQYENVVKGKFISRPNRFIAYVEVDSKQETVHVKNTGRCKELLIPGCTVYLSKSDNPARKTKYDLIATEKITADGALLINMDSQIPNDVVEEWLHKGALFSTEAKIRREVTYGASRFDFYVEDQARKIFLEVKGCTLEKDGIALFPDAPTERGIKHLRELTDCVKNGYEAYVLFVIQMKGISQFSPNDQTHPAFGEALRTAASAGVRVLALDCTVTPDRIALDSPIEVCL
jgi:sugar fermentation stimulation protein A